VGGLVWEKDREVVPFARGGDARLLSARVYPLTSVWEKFCCEDN
jgi:hypothetical protein